MINGNDHEIEIPSQLFTIFNEYDRFIVKTISNIDYYFFIKTSFCVLIYDDSPDLKDSVDNDATPPDPFEPPSKLKILRDTSDGFKIAEEDLR